MDEPKNDSNEQKIKEHKSDLDISIIINKKPSSTLVILVQEYYTNEYYFWYCRREYLEILGILGGVGDKDLENKMIEF